MTASSPSYAGVGGDEAGQGARTMSDLRGIDINLIVVLDAVLTERNLTRAAEAIGSTQPAMSSAMVKLRKMLDDPLLVRSGSVSTLTPRAAALAPVVKAALTEIGRTLNTRPHFDPATSERQFRLSASDYALAVMTAPLLKLLEEEAPRVSVEFSPLNAIGPVDLLREDVAVASASRGVPGKRQSLFSDSMVCIVRRDHPATTDGRLDLTDLAALPYVQVAFGEGIVMYADDVLSAAGIFPRVTRTVPGFLGVPYMVSDSDMFGFVPARLASLYADELAITTVEIPLSLPVLVESAFWHPSRGDDPALRWLVATLRKAAERVEFSEPDAVS